MTIFRIGDLVIKKTGGNKMRVLFIDGDKIECGWYCDNYHEGLFDLDELMLFKDFDLFIKSERRQDILSQILN